MLFDDPRYHWRETYFVLTKRELRPPSEKVKSGLFKVLPGLVIRSEEQDAEGRLSLLSAVSEDSHAGIEIVWNEGPRLSEEIAQLVDELQNEAEEQDRLALERAREATAKIELLHFEQLDRATPPSPVKPRKTRAPGRNIAEAQRLSSGRFHFDPDHYAEPPPGLDTGENDSGEFLLEEYDSAVLTPDTLIVAIEVLRRLTDG